MRRRFDFYETPPHYVDALQRVIGVPRGRLIEPCVGRGAVIDMLKVDGVWHANDLNARREASTHFDAARKWPGSGSRIGRWDWGITNPPFKPAVMLPIVRNMLRYCNNVAFLARLSFLEPTIERRLFWTRWAPHAEVIVLPRYSFRRSHGRKQTDSVTCCWIVFRQGYSDRQLYVSNRTEDRSR